MTRANIRETTHISVVYGFYDPRKATVYHYKVDKDDNWKIYSLHPDGIYSYWVPLGSKPPKCFPVSEFPKDFLPHLG